MRYWFALGLIGLALSLGACQPQTAPNETAQDTVFESPHFTVTTRGQGPHVILVPGLASNAAVWDTTVAAIGANYTTHVIQVSGFGGAPARGNDDNTEILESLSRDLATYAAALDGEVTMVGHSLGGLVTMKTALLPDAPLDAIVIVDVLPFFSVLMDDDATAQSIAPIAGMMKATLLAQTDNVFASSQDTALKSLVKGEANRATALSWSVQSDRKVMAQAMSEVLVTDLRAEVAQLQIPVTVIYARDAMIPNMDKIETYYQTLYAPIPNVQIQPIDNALHFIMMDQPEAFFTLLEAAITG